MLKIFFRSSTQALASDALMKLPSQKMAVWAMHPPVHFACRDAVQLALPMAWHDTSQERFAWPLQLPWQLPMQAAEQLADGATPVQLALQ